MPVVSACGRWSSFDGRWGVVVVFVVAGGHALVFWALAVVCWPLSSLHAFVESLGGWRRFGRLALFVVV